MTSSRRAALVIPLAIAATLAACDTPTGVRQDASFTARWAGSPWQGSAWAMLLPGPTGDTLYVGGSAPPNSGSMPLQAVTFRITGFTGPGTYQLASADVVFRQLVGGDVVVSTYVGAGAPAATLVISRFDPVSRVVEGTVHARMVFSTGHVLHGANPEFENGAFEAELQTYQPPAPH